MRVFSEEHRRNLSEAAKRKKLSPEHKRKIAEAQRGKSHTEKTKSKMSAAYTPERRQKNAELVAERNRKREWKPESRAKLARAMASRVQERKAETALELRIAERLDGRHFLTQAKIDGDESHVWDFVLPEERLLIEADGCYWHGCDSCDRPGMPTNRKSDARKKAVAKKLGWRLVTVKECEVESHPLF